MAWITGARERARWRRFTAKQRGRGAHICRSCGNGNDSELNHDAVEQIGSVLIVWCDRGVRLNGLCRGAISWNTLPSPLYLPPSSVLRNIQNVLAPDNLVF